MNDNNLPGTKGRGSFPLERASVDELKRLLGHAEHLRGRIRDELKRRSMPAQSTPSFDRLLTADEVAEILAVKKSKVYELARTGELESVPVGRYTRFTRRAVERYLNEIQKRR